MRDNYCSCWLRGLQLKNAGSKTGNKEETALETAVGDRQAGKKLKRKLSRTLALTLLSLPAKARTTTNTLWILSTEFGIPRPQDRNQIVLTG